MFCMHQTFFKCIKALKKFHVFDNVIIYAMMKNIDFFRFSLLGENHVGEKTRG